MKPHHSWWLVGSSLLTMVLSYGTRFSFAVFYLSLLEQFGWDNATTASIVSVNTLIYAVSAPFAGGMVDRLGPRRVLVLGALLLGLGMVLAGAANALWQFYVLYGVLVAVGNSLTGMTPNVTAVSRRFGPKSQSIAIGIINSGLALAIAVSLAAQGLVSAVGWRWAYVTIGILAPAVIIPVVLVAHRGSPQHVENVALLPDGSTAPAFSVSRTLREVAGNGRFWLLGLVFFSSFGLFAGILYTHQIPFVVSKGYTPSFAAFVFTFFGIVQAGGNWLGGIAASRVGCEVSYIAGWGCAVLGVVALLSVSVFAGPWPLYVWAVLTGVGYGVLAPVNNSTVAQLFGGRNLGLIFGLVTAIFGLGGAIGPWLGGLIVDVTGSYTDAFVVALGALTVALIAMWIVAPSKTRASDLAA